MRCFEQVLILLTTQLKKNYRVHTAERHLLRSNISSLLFTYCKVNICSVVDPKYHPYKCCFNLIALCPYLFPCFTFCFYFRAIFSLPDFVNVSAAPDCSHLFPNKPLVAIVMVFLLSFSGHCYFLLSVGLQQIVDIIVYVNNIHLLTQKFTALTWPVTAFANCWMIKSHYSSNMLIMCGYTFTTVWPHVYYLVDMI